MAADVQRRLQDTAEQKMAVVLQAAQRSSSFAIG